MESKREAVQAALSAYMGQDKAARFSPAELDRLHQNGYMTAQDLQDARENSLNSIGLLQARIDAIVAAHGEQPRHQLSSFSCSPAQLVWMTV